ncbi:AzlD domain-containing protein [Gordonia amarae]|uniref:Branched-chain amino acid transporter n=2 Tax=Gordonia amarae TaxID=36821 RepID=G7GP80_9ACTN|nr:AzlD domain-containing protein [Gordonia amarae]MCS3878008.1 branched-subunit amino acid transport protein [Gordonia amarae]QHN16709.1 AzlD domain-containing protein [Gordonia amarae]QHN21234.1 AzlD domain-containing protein [Gordonia amarae]QHN30088.1 AzlD domain-containing protein [Gordonia amarae]QHN38861.1 AzlD domain-containing protein [Gordonia amarae]
MTSVLIGVAVLAVGTYLLRLAGPLLQSRIRLSDGTRRVLDRGAVVLLVAVAVTGALYADGDFTGWARPLGVGAGVVAAFFKPPLVAIVLIAAVTTAALRAAGVA